MKLNYRDKVLLAVVLSIAILLAAFFAIVKPKNADIKSTKKTLETEQKKEKDIKTKINQIGDLKVLIRQFVDDTNDIVENFVPIEDVDDPVLLDEYMQDFINSHEVRITNLAVSDMKETSISYYYISVGEIGSGLRDLADFTGEYQAQVNADQAEQNDLSMRGTPTLLETVYALEGKCTKENLWKVMEDIENYDNTVIITSVDYSKIADENDNRPDDDPEKQEIKPEDEVQVTMTISLYSVFELKEPNYDN